jgi:hypothetical protein
MHRLADIAEAKIGEIKTVLDAEGMRVKEYTETPLREQRGAIDSIIKVGIPQVKEASTEDVKDRLSQMFKITHSELPRLIASLPPERVAGALIELWDPLWQ